MPQVLSRLEALDSVRQWIIAQRDDAAKGLFMASALHAVIGLLAYAIGAAVLFVGTIGWIRNGWVALGVTVSGMAFTLGTALIAAFFRRRRGIPFADGRVYPDEIEVDNDETSYERVLGLWIFGLLHFWLAGAFGRFARWVTVQWIDDVRNARALLTLDAGVAAEMLERGLDAHGAAPLIDLECVQGARALTLQALCAFPGIVLRGGKKPGLVVSDDARERIMRDLGWSR